MTPYIWLGIALLLLILLIARIGVSVAYGEKGVLVKLSYLPFTYTLYPRPPAKKTGKPDKAPKPKKKKPEKERKDKLKDMLPGDFSTFRQLLSDTTALLKKIGRYLRIDKMDIDYVAAGSDAFDTAMQYGGAYAVAGLAYDTISSMITVKKHDIRIYADFLSGKPKIFVIAKISIAVWQLFAILFAGIKFYLQEIKPLQRKNQLNKKAV